MLGRAPEAPAITLFWLGELRRSPGHLRLTAMVSSSAEYATRALASFP